jgi:type II secretory pathway predicted ATPase ExeA
MDTYHKFWKVKGPLFSRQPPVSDLFFSKECRGKLEELKLAAELDDYLLLISGLPGTGKKSAFRWFYETLSVDSHEILIANVLGQKQRRGWLYERLAAYFRPGEDFATEVLYSQLGDWLDELADDDKILILSIIDAQKLDSDSISDLLNLNSLQGLSKKRLKILLILDTTNPENILQDLNQEVALHLKLAPLTSQDTRAYIEHIFSSAGISTPISKDAIEVIHEATGGIIGLINKICERALIEGFTQKKRAINLALIQPIILELKTMWDRAKILPQLVADKAAVPNAARALRGEQRAAGDNFSIAKFFKK